MKVFVIACGASKNATKPGQRVRALDLYAGRQFGMARRLEAAGWVVMVLSAKHGLIPAAMEIETYDHEMNAARARELSADGMQAHLFNAAFTGAETAVFYGGEHYFRVFERMVSKLGVARLDRETRCEVVSIVGAGCGDHYSTLKEIIAEEGA